MKGREKDFYFIFLGERKNVTTVSECVVRAAE
jgi:hypothetical protein